MKVQVLQHVPFEGIGSMASWLSDRGASVEHTRFTNPENSPRSTVSIL